MDALDIALDTLGQCLGIDGIVFADDECQIEIGDTLVDLTAERSRQRLVLSAFVGEIPDEGGAGLLSRLLDANCHPAMRGAAVGVPAGSGAVVVRDQLDVRGIDTAGLEGALEDFLAAVDHVRAQFTPSKALHTAEPADDGAIMLRL